MEGDDGEGAHMLAHIDDRKGHSELKKQTPCM